MLKSLEPDTKRVIVVGKTANGKEIGYRETGRNCFKEVCFKDGGQVPDKLKGNWTDIMRMRSAINSYIKETEAKAKEKPLKKTAKAS